jgi:hypothetical protein
VQLPLVGEYENFGKIYQGWQEAVSIIINRSLNDTTPDRISILDYDSGVEIFTGTLPKPRKTA